MQYLNKNFVKAIQNNGKYKSAIAKIKQEVDDFASNFTDDPMKTSEWGHSYFCDYDGGRLIFDIQKPHTHKCSVCGKERLTRTAFDGCR